MKKLIFSLAIAGLFAGACQNKKSRKEQQQSNSEKSLTTPSANSSFFYTYDNSQTSVEWTAFKTTAKTAVGGKFNTFTVTGTKRSIDPKKVIENLSFRINTASVNTNMKERDVKIVSYFFKKMVNTEFISGSVKSLGKKGKGMLSLTMNNVTKDLPIDFRISGDTVRFSGTINLGKWNGSQAVKSLNKNCYVLHTGKDGISKLWPEVAFKVSTLLKKTEKK